MSDAVTGSAAEAVAGDRHRVAWTAESLARATFAEQQDVVPGMFTEGLTILAGPPKAGKALWVETPVLCERGWVRMGDVVVGDRVHGANGELVDVVAVTEVLEDRSCYRVQTRSGRSLITDAEHQWAVRVGRPGVGAVVTTAQMAATGLRSEGGSHWLYHIAAGGVVKRAAVDLPVDPYTLGVWLGDGTTVRGEVTLNALDYAELLARVPYELGKPHDKAGSRGVALLGLQVQLRELGVLGAKHVPDEYLLGSAEQRAALLAGLLDTDGHAATRPNGSGAVEFMSTSLNLAESVLTLAISLGYKAKMTRKDATLRGRVIGDAWRVTWAAGQSESPFLLSRKTAALPERRVSGRSGLDAVVLVEAMDSVPVRCIQVAAADGVYLAGRTLLPTHNSWLSLQAGLDISRGEEFLEREVMPDCEVLYLALEDGPRRLKNRIAASMAGVGLGGLAGGGVRDGLHLFTKWPEGERGVAVLRKWLEAHPAVKFVVVDVLAVLRGLARGGYSGDYRVMRGLKEIADDFGISVLVITHTRKAGRGKDSDPFASIMGTAGVTGAADTLMVLRPVSVDGKLAALHVRGRDVEGLTLELHLEDGRWFPSGAEATDRREERRAGRTRVLDSLASEGAGGFTAAEAGVMADVPEGFAAWVLDGAAKDGAARVDAAGRYVWITTAERAHARAPLSAEPVPDLADPGFPARGMTE